MAKIPTRSEVEVDDGNPPLVPLFPIPFFRSPRRFRLGDMKNRTAPFPLTFPLTSDAFNDVGIQHDELLIYHH
jgi:hypothetical protein